MNTDLDLESLFKDLEPLDKRLSLKTVKSPYWLQIEHLFLYPQQSQRIQLALPKIVQKSYGHEKRLFTPQPMVQTTGQERYTVICRTQQQDETRNPMEQEDGCALSLIGDGTLFTGIYKYLYTSTMNGGELVLLFDFNLNGQTKFTIEANPLRIVSKPPKRNNKNPELFIKSQSYVCLFNRVNSQSSSTRYLVMEGSDLVPSKIKWQYFRIVKESSDELIKFDDIVHLEHESGIKTSPLIIRQIQDNAIISGSDNNVTQLTRVALELCDLPGCFLFVSDKCIDICQLNQSKVSEFSLWSLVCVDVIQTGVMSLGPCQIPRITKIQIESDQALSIRGLGLTRDLWVYFGHVPCKSVIWRSQHTLWVECIDDMHLSIGKDTQLVEIIFASPFGCFQTSYFLNIYS